MRPKRSRRGDRGGEDYEDYEETEETTTEETEEIEETAVLVTEYGANTRREFQRLRQQHREFYRAPAQRVAAPVAAAAASEMAERLEAEDLAAEAGRRNAAEASGRRKAGGGTTDGAFIAPLIRSKGETKEGVELCVHKRHETGSRGTTAGHHPRQAFEKGFVDPPLGLRGACCRGLGFGRPCLQLWDALIGLCIPSCTTRERV